MLTADVPVSKRFKSSCYKKAFLLLFLVVDMCGGLVSLAQEKPGQMSDQYIKDVPSERFERYIEEGMSFFNEHYYLGADLSWGHALEIDPLNEEVQTLIAGALERFE
ncbi:MAG: hypothetical protein ACUVWJ_03320 [Spirochaetota bacterium]